MKKLIVKKIQANEQIFTDSVTLFSKRIEANQDNIINEIPVEILTKLKESDPHPFIQKYSICHEGTSTPRIIGEKSQPIHWSRKAIQSIKNVVLKGVKIFRGHNKDNSTENRTVIGEIIHDAQQEIDGKLNHIIYTYHNPSQKEEAKDLDSCSQEADWNFFNAAGRLIADSIKKLTGVAFGKSNENKPAFSGAIRLGLIQAFEDKIITTPPKQESLTMTYDEIKKEVSFATIKQLCADLNVWPWQLFEEKDLRQDREFGKIFDEFDKLKLDNKKLTDDLTVSIENAKGLERKTLVSDAKTRLNDIAKENNITEKTPGLLKFVTERFTENQEDLTDEGLKKFIQTEIKTYQDAMRLSGAKTEEIQIPSGDDKSSSDDYSKAENNPLLKEDIEPII